VGSAHDKVFALAIESSNPSSADGIDGGGPGVALAEVAHRAGAWSIVGAIGIESLRRQAGREDDLMPAIDRICKREGIAAARVGLVAVSVGPGGFTALRVAVTIGNAIAFATGAACVAIPSALVVARRVACPGRFAVLLASKGETSFATVFSPGWDRGSSVMCPQGSLVRAGDIKGLDVEMLVSDKFLPAPIREAAERAGVPVVPPHFDPAACLELGCRLPVAAPGSLAPVYAREPEAVTLWKARQKP